MGAELVIGADFGTEGVKGALFAPDGSMRATASQPYPTRFPAPGRAEQDPADWWRVLGAATRRVLANSATSPDRVVGTGDDATACSVVLAEASGAPRAILEVVGYGTASVIEAMRAAGVSGDEVRICGRACNSQVWSQIHADTAGVPLVVPEVTEAAAPGSAVTAAESAGWFPTLAEASEPMVRFAPTIEPDPATAETYEFYWERYGATYRALADEMHLVSDRVANHG